MTFRRVGWILIALGCTSANERDIEDPRATRVDSLIRLADSVYRQDYDSATRLWTRAREFAAAVGDSANIARALTGIAMAARIRGDWEGSRRIGEQALAIKERLRMAPRDMFRSYNALGLLAWNSERLSDATSLFERAGESARVANDSVLLAMVTINTGLVAKDLGAFVRSREAFLLGRDIARSVGDSVNLGRALVNLASLDITLGDPLAAITSIEDSRRLARSTGDSLTEVNARGQLANAYMALGEPQRAFALLDSALTMAQRRGQRQEVAEDLLLIGDLFFEAGDHQHALDHYRRAQLATDSVDQPEERGNIMRSEARAHAALENFTAARDLAAEALRIHRAGEFLHSQLGDLLVLAEVAQRDGRPADAATHLASAERMARALEAPIGLGMVAIARARVASLASQWNRVLDAIEGARGTLYLVGSSGEAEARALHARALGELGRFEAALAAGRQAIAAVEQVRANYATGDLRTSYTASKANVYSQQVLLLLRIGQVNEAFEVADAARGRALLEHLTQARADLVTGSGPTQLLEQESLLRRIDALLGQLRERERQPPQERSSEHRAATAYLRDSLDALRAEYTALAARHGEIRGTRALVGIARPGATEIRRSLRAGEVLLEYLVTPDRLLIFVVTPDTVNVHVVAEKAEALTSRVQLARELLRQRDGEVEARGVLRALFDIVLGPVARSGTLRTANRLIVVPHGVLTYLPFAALADSAGYVAERFVLLHLPTSAALPALRSASLSTRPSPAAAVFAPLPRELRATRGEALAVASAVAGAEVHIGSDATERRFRAALQRGGIVHVASHAMLNSRNPLFSHIELAGRPAGVSANDGRLEAHELLALRIDATLVFLSGCETAIGGSWATRFDMGEDYAAIAQTLLYAGARNVVATLWRIDDDAAAEFARAFYEALRGTGYAEAIATAQRRLLADARYRSPYFWAPFQLSGSGLGEHRQNRSAASDKH